MQPWDLATARVREDILLRDTILGLHAVSLDGARVAAAKNESLSKVAINFNDVPRWQRRGTDRYGRCRSKEGYTLKRPQRLLTIRRRRKLDHKLPLGQG